LNPIDNRVNYLLSFILSFIVDEVIRLKLNRKFQERSCGGKKGSIQIQSTTVE